MKIKSTLSLSIVLTFLLINSNFLNAQNETIKLSTFSFTVPDGMKNLTKGSDVLAKLGFENSLYISVDDNMEKMLELHKKNPRKAGGMNMERFAFDLKFKGIMSKYKGYDPTEKKEGTLNGIKYTAQMFSCKATKTQEAYLEYRVMEIGGKHYEFIVTGKIENRKEYLPMIKKFWKSIVVKK